jgi:gamma-glutamylcyclotransferase (GGCT)/AIG2-like uncharacterized protein YtfP
MVTIAVYGSLKKGLHNYHKMGPSAKFLGKTMLEGTMYDVGGYPVLMETKGEQPESEYEAEIYSVEKEYYSNVYQMEINSGYIVKEVNTKYGNAGVFYGDKDYFTEKRLERLTKVNQWPK